MSQDASSVDWLQARQAGFDTCQMRGFSLATASRKTLRAISCLFTGYREFILTKMFVLLFIKANLFGIPSAMDLRYTH
jgi:hypothetical protein